MKTYKSLEKKTRILGMPLQDLGLLLVLLIGLVLLGSGLSILFPVPKWYYVSVLISLIGLYTGLRLANRRHHPAFVAAYLSFHLLQPRRISHFPHAFAHDTNP